LPYPSSEETNIEKVPHIGVVMKWCAIMLSLKAFIRQQDFDASYAVVAGNVKQAATVTIASKKNGPNIPLEDTEHHTVFPGKLTAHFSVIFQFSDNSVKVTSTD
jgi:hypothetical protein